MAKQKSSNFDKDFEKSLGSKKTISYVFLGIGLCLFFLNISVMLSFLPQTYSFTAFDISVFSSIIMVLFAVYNLHYDN
ncbi:MAG: hypothetical protein KC550_04675 [Nanoarchaeota archaeon]|nr:hypothetical protein [Nanoarchaeota archaeon]